MLLVVSWRDTSPLTCESWCVQVLLRTLYLSLDPYMRGRMSTAKSYAAGLQVK